MHHIVTIIAVSSALFPLLSAVSSAADDARDVPIASYRNTEQLRKTVGQRVRAILREHKIESSVVKSYAATVVVPADQALEAQQLLAKAIRTESLQLSLLAPKNNGYVEVTPESVLEPTANR